MNYNRKIEQLIYFFTDPYSNDKVNNLLEKLESRFFFPEIDDLKEELISLSGEHDLERSYSESDYDFIKEQIEKSKED